MATRSNSFKKRQKELARLEKRRSKAAKRMQRKLEKRPADAGDASNLQITTDPGSLPNGMA